MVGERGIEMEWDIGEKGRRKREGERGREEVGMGEKGSRKRGR